MSDRICPFPDPSKLDDDALASVAVTLAGFLDDSRRVFEEHRNPVTKWLLARDELASDYVTAMVEDRIGRAFDSGELNGA